MHLRLLLFFLFAGTCVCAQTDFQLFRPGVQYLYENPDFNSKTYQIATQYYGVKVDSLGCQELYGSLQPDDVFGDGIECVSRVPSPFGYSLCQTADSTVMEFGGTDRLVIYQRAEIGTRWVARDSAGVRTMGEVLGQVTANDTATVLGLSDELKAIGLFSEAGALLGPPVIISRQYGLVEGMRFYQPGAETQPLRLAGMSAPLAGVQRPPAAAYGAASVGDIYHVETTVVQQQNSPTQTDIYFLHQFETAEVIGVDTLAADTIDYTFRSDVLNFRSPSRSTAGGRDSVLVRDSVFHRHFTPPAAGLTDLQPGARTPKNSTLGINYVYLVKLYQQKCDLLSIRFSTEVVFTENDDCGFDASAVDSGPQEAYTANVPFYLDSLDYLTGVYYKTLLYAETAGIECGTPIDLSDIIIATDDFSAALDAAIQVYPNPTTDQLRIEVPQTVGEVSVRLYNVAGAQVQRQPFGGNASTILTTSGLPRGAYFLVIFEDDRPVARRRVVLH